MDGSVVGGSQALGLSANQSQNLQQIDETDSDEDSSDEEEELDESQEADRAAQRYTELHYSNEKSAEEVNFDLYHFSVAQKYDLTQRSQQLKKVKYIRDELLLDLRWRVLGHFDDGKKLKPVHTTLALILLLFFLRSFIHYTGQYAILTILQVPVTKFEFRWHRVELEYAAWNFTQECAVVAVGPLANTAIFGLLFLWSALTRRWCGCFPQYFYKVICWIGVYAILDPFLVLFFDLCTANWKNGDMFKFYHHFETVGDSGIVGAYIAVFMIGSFTIFTGFLWYRYMIGYYMNGRIIDLYRRLSGQYKAFFIPIDNEVSLNYLKWVITRAKKKDHVIMSEKRPIRDKYGKEKIVNFIQIFKVEQEKDKDGHEIGPAVLRKSRVFFKDYDGSLLEVPQSKVLVKTKELRKLRKAAGDGDNDLAKTFRGSGTSSAVIAHAYGAYAEIPLSELCANTANFHKSQRDHNAAGARSGSVASPRGGEDGQFEDFDAEEEKVLQGDEALRRRGTMLAAPLGGPSKDGFAFPASKGRDARHKSLKQKPSIQLANDLASAPPQIDEANEEPFHNSRPSQSDEQDDEESQRFL